MNQILLTDEEKYKDKNNRNPKTNKSDLKPILMAFGVFLLVFGIAMIGIYGYKIYTNSNKQEEPVGKPQLSLEETENSVKIIAKADAGISKIIYIWNEDEETEFDMNGRTSHEEIIDIPAGESTLKVKVIDVNNEEIETFKEFINLSAEKPVIATEIGENAKLKITATDETAIKYITYKWNDEEPITIEAESESDTVIELEIDVKRGKNDFEIIAVDSDGNEAKENKIFNGVNKPVIKVKKRGSELYMKITHDMGFEKVEFTINGKEYKYDENHRNYDATKQELEYKLKLKEGENTVTILAVSTEGTEEKYKGRCNYTVEQ